MLKYIAKVLYVLTGRRRSLVLLLFIFTLTSILEALGIGLVGPFLKLASTPDSIHEIAVLNWAYGQLDLQESRQFIPVLGLGIIIIFCIKSFLYFCSRSYIYRFSYNQKKLLMSRLLATYLRIPYTFHLSRNSASLIKNIIIEADQFTQLCLLELLNATSNLVVIIVLVSLLAKTDLVLLVLIMGVFLPTIVFFNLLRSKFKNWGRMRSESKQEMIRVLNHGLGGLKETRVIGCERYFERQMEQQGQKFARSTTLFQSFQLVPRILIETTLIIFLVGFICLSQVLGERSMQELISILGVFAIAAIRLIPSASQFIQGMGKMQNGSYTLDMLYFDLKEIEKQKSGKPFVFLPSLGAMTSNQAQADQDKPIKFHQQIDLLGVTYSYPGTSKAALQDITLTIQKDQSIAFIGKSGAGKTTLVDVILGLLELEHGDIRVDGVSIYDNLRSWQNLVGYIPQSIFLIDDTIERNIAFGVSDELVDSERLEQVIQAAQLQELIEQLPQGIKTEVGERGVRLSGGQRQRVGIARALYHEREILILDEATAALDNETEQYVTEAIKSLAGTKTLIIIAHRLSTVEHCDAIYVLEGGNVIKSGSYQEVVMIK